MTPQGILDTIAISLGYVVMAGAGITAVGVAWWLLIDAISKFLGLNKTFFAAAWLILREPELVKRTREKHFGE